MTFQVKFNSTPHFDVGFGTSLNISGGYDDGYNDGYTTGKSEGLTEGEDIGYNKGSSEVMQEFVDGRGLTYLYYNQTVSDGMLDWLTKVDLSNITSLASMFAKAQMRNTLTEFPLLDTKNVTSFYSMFSEANFAKAPYLNTANATTMSAMFFKSTLTECPAYDYSNVVKTTQMFQQSNLRVIPPIVFPSGKTELNCDSMFYWAYLTSIDITFNSPSKASNMFDGNSYLVTADLKNTHWFTSASSLFNGCSKLLNIPPIDLINTKLGIPTMFKGCKVLTEISLTNTKNVLNINYLCQDCYELVSIGTIDMRSSTSASSAFANCRKLTNLTLKNIKCNLQVGSGTSYGHLLTLESLIGLCYELRDTGSSLTLTVGSANLEKLANVYVREIPITDAMREADDLIDEKLPFEVCDSTADGATLITDYVLLKNWKLA